MNSLTELNGYNAVLTLPYTDQRLANVFFDRETANNRTQIVNEGSTFDIVLGIEITDISNAGLAAPVFRVNVSSLSGTTVSWTGLPANCTVTNPATGIYEVSGMLSELDWQIVRQAKITLPGTVPNGFVGNWTYSCTISYFQEASGSKTKSWTVGVSVLDVIVITNPLDFIFALGTSQHLLYTPQIINLDAQYPNAIWTVSGTPSSPPDSIVSFASTSTSGGTFTFIDISKGFIITGTRAQVNAHLNSITFTSSSIATDFTIEYEVTNNAGPITDIKTQFLKNPNLLYLSNPTTYYYVEDIVEGLVINGSSITDTGYSGTENYTMTVRPSVESAITTITTYGFGGTTSFDNTSKIMTIVGTKVEVNSHLANLRITMASDYASAFSLIYSVTTPESNHAVKIQSLICGSNDDEVTNMNITRTYVANNPNVLFATNAPTITDFDITGNDIYTVFFSSSLGSWELPVQVTPYIAGPLVSTLSISGTRAEVNAAFPKIRFYPDFGVNTTGTFNYQQQKNGVLQVNQTVGLTNSGTGTYTPREQEFLVSQTWTPLPADIKYGKITKALVVGGGGGGEAGYIRSGSSHAYGGGGGGGGAVIIKDSAYSYNFTQGTTYTINIGLGGAGAKNPTNGTIATDGQSTSAFGITALGGSKGYIVNPEQIDAQGYGGSGKITDINGTQTGPFAGGTSGYWKGGGGGGSTSVGVSSTTPSNLEPATNEGYGGDGKTYDGKTNWFGAGGNGGFVTIRSEANGQTTGGIGGGTTGPAGGGENNSGSGGGGGGGIVNSGYAGGQGGTGYVKIWITSK